MACFFTIVVGWNHWKRPHTLWHPSNQFSVPPSTFPCSYSVVVQPVNSEYKGTGTRPFTWRSLAALNRITTNVSKVTDDRPSSHNPVLNWIGHLIQRLVSLCVCVCVFRSCCFVTLSFQPTYQMLNWSHHNVWAGWRFRYRLTYTWYVLVPTGSDVIRYWIFFFFVSPNRKWLSADGFPPESGQSRMTSEYPLLKNKFLTKMN